MYKISKTTINKQDSIVYPLIGALVSFVAIFILTSIVLATVYGYDFTNSQYIETIQIAQNAATNLTQNNNNEIDQYVQSIKDDICLTLKPNQTAVNECFRL